MNRSISLCAFALVLFGCPARPSGQDAGNDVILAPIDTGVAPADGAASDGGALDVAPRDDAADSATDAVDRDALDAANDAGADGAATDAARRCSDAGAGDSGCVLCPSSSGELLNQCTLNGCTRFDNSRCGRLLPDGGLPPLP